MSKYLTRQAAAKAFAKGESPFTKCALRFVGNVAFSYDEPIAVRDGGFLYYTGPIEGKSLTRMYSATTAQHIGSVRGAWAVEHRWSENYKMFSCHPGTIRRMARDKGMPVGTWGNKFELENAS